MLDERTLWSSFELVKAASWIDSVANEAAFDMLSMIPPPLLTSVFEVVLLVLDDLRG